MSISKGPKFNSWRYDFASIEEFVKIKLGISLIYEIRIGHMQRLIYLVT